MIIVTIVMILLVLFMCGAFDSKEERKRKQRLKTIDQRWDACLKGKIPDDEMRWYERIITPYRVFLNKQGRNGYDPQKTEWPKMITALYECQRALYDEYKSNAMGERKSLYGDLMIAQDQKSTEIAYSESFLRETIQQALLIARESWRGDTVSFVDRYAYAIIVLGVVGDYAKKAYEEGGWTNKKEVYKKCAQIVDNGWLKNMFLSEILGIDNGIRLIAEQIKKAEAAKLRRKQGERIESSGGFQQVHTGDEYERFVMFCVKDAGHTCKKVGGTGDYGADLVVDIKGKSLVIQCKFYSTPVGYDAIQQVYAAKSIYKGAWCCVVSNAGFTRQAVVGGRKLGVRLLSHVDIAEYLKSLMEGC